MTCVCTQISGYVVINGRAYWSINETIICKQSYSTLDVIAVKMKTTLFYSYSYVRYMFFECCNFIRAETWGEFASSCSPTQHRNQWTNVTLGCTGLLYDALLVYKATLHIVLTLGYDNHLLTRKFNLATMKPNLHHLFRFVDLAKICNMKAVAIGTVELRAKLKTKWRREL